MKSTEYGMTEEELFKELAERVKVWRRIAKTYTELQRRLSPLHQSLSDIHIMFEIMEQITPFMTGAHLQKLRDNQSLWDAQSKSITNDLDSLILEYSEPFSSTIRLEPHNFMKQIRSNLEHAKELGKKLREKARQQENTFQKVEQHSQTIIQQIQSLSQDSATKELAAHLTKYKTEYLEKKQQQICDQAETLLTSESTDDHSVQNEATIMDNVAQAIFHRKPSLSHKIHLLCSQMQEFCQETEKILVEKLKRTVTNVTYKTPEERKQHLLELLEKGNKYISGSDMNFTFTDAALQEFRLKAPIYKQLAVEALNLGLSEHLPNGSLTPIGSSHHPYVDKNRDDNILKIRSQSGTSGDNNLPRIFVQRLPYGPNKKERFCIVAFVTKKEQETKSRQALQALAGRPVVAWPQEEDIIVQLNPIMLPLSIEEQQEIQTLIQQFTKIHKKTAATDSPSEPEDEDGEKTAPTAPPTPPAVPPAPPAPPIPETNSLRGIKDTPLGTVNAMTANTIPSPIFSASKKLKGIKVTSSDSKSSKANNEGHSQATEDKQSSQRVVGIEQFVYVLQLVKHLQIIHQRQAEWKNQRQRHTSDSLQKNLQRLVPFKSAKIDK